MNHTEERKARAERISGVRGQQGSAEESIKLEGGGASLPPPLSNFIIGQTKFNISYL